MSLPKQTGKYGRRNPNTEKFVSAKIKQLEQNIDKKEQDAALIKQRQRQQQQKREQRQKQQQIDKMRAPSPSTQSPTAPSSIRPRPLPFQKTKPKTKNKINKQSPFIFTAPTTSSEALKALPPTAAQIAQAAADAAAQTAQAAADAAAQTATQAAATQAAATQAAAQAAATQAAATQAAATQAAATHAAATQAAAAQAAAAYTAAQAAAQAATAAQVAAHTAAQAAQAFVFTQPPAAAAQPQPPAAAAQPQPPAAAPLSRDDQVAELQNQIRKVILLIQSILKMKKEAEMQATIIWKTCPPHTTPFNQRELIHSGISLPKFMHVTRDGQACISPHKLAKLTREADLLVNKSRHLVTMCGRLMRSLEPIAASSIDCDAINHFQNVTDNGKQTLCSTVARCKYDAPTKKCLSK